jgi:hypothetical protein
MSDDFGDWFDFYDNENQLWVSLSAVGGTAEDSVIGDDI